MRRPFYLDDLTPQERTTVKRWHTQVIAIYSMLALMVMGLAAVKVDRVQSQLAKIRPTFDLGGEAIAATRPGSPACAERDIRIVTLIDDASAARSVPDRQLTDAFLMLVNARDLCAAGRTAEALAVYDGITVVPANTVMR
jgi:hypothetical protein